MNQGNIFKNTNRPNKNLFFKSKDKNERKLGNVVASNTKDYGKCKYVLIGCPQDEGVQRNNGRVGAALAPDKIREMFYRFNAPVKLKDGELFDIGNTRIGKTLEKTHEIHHKVVHQLLEDGKQVFVLGGGNDISYPDCSALSKQTKSVLALNIDSHFDVRENRIRNSGTPYRQLLEEKFLSPINFYELANQDFANSQIYQDYLMKKKVNVFNLEKLRSKGISKSISSILKQNKASSIFWGFDIDSVRSSDAPGVSASYPTGLTAEEILSIAALAGSDRRSKIFEITEVNPKYDIDNRTSKLAALLIIAFLQSNLK